MTNLEYIRTCCQTELAYLLCKLSSPDGTIHCSDCVANEFCHRGHNGFIEWLEKQKDGE